MLLQVTRHFPLFFLASIYSMVLSLSGQWGDSLGTIVYLSALCLLLVKRGLMSDIESIPSLLDDLCLHQLAISLGVLLGIILTKGEASILWPLDAINTHIPLSENASQAFQGLRSWKDVGLHIPGAVIHTVTGLFFAVLGKNLVATTLSLLCFKLATIAFVFLLAKDIYNSRVAYLAGLIYVFAPTVQFYTLTFYKEASIHLFIVATFYFTYHLFIKHRFLMFFPLALSLLLLAQERFYLVFLFIPTFLVLGLFSSSNYKTIKIIVCCILLGVLIRYNVYLQQSPMWMMEKLKEFRSAHMQFKDFSYKYNYEIPYILAFFKSLFTPYFTFKKLQTFFDLSNLLTWGSFLNQATIVAACMGYYKSIKGDKVLHIALIIPLIILLCCLAYISPWSGRLRDSFYPLIAIYAAFFLLSNQLIERFYFSIMKKIKLKSLNEL